MGAMSAGMGGVYGEQLAASMGNTAIGAANMGNTIMGAGLGAATMGVGSLGMGMALGGAAMIPGYIGSQVIGAYGGALQSGMNQQAALNSTLRNSFSFYGGQGRMGRGFSQNQMGQIGGVIENELQNNVFTSAQELNTLISGGAQAGMFTGVRDVQEFSQKFRKMIDTLKTVQRELGGSLEDALTFVRQSKSAGIFQEVDRTNFAGQLRGAEAASGLSQSQLMNLSQQGAGIARAVGGYGRQGAYGALRAASTLGGAIQSGAINEELLSEATGGLTGSEAVQAMVGQMMQRSARFSRRGMGRFSIFAMANQDGTGLDDDMMRRFLAGDISTGEVSRTAHRNVSRMGRARAMNQEGVLRGSLLEQGGLAGQIGMMRLMVGDRVMGQSDDLASLVLQRRFRMSRPQAEMMMSLMRNQSSIAEQEAFDRSDSGRQQALQNDLTHNRSVDALMRNLSQGMRDATGVTRAKEMGRNLVSRVSSLVERAVNDMIGIAENQVTQGDRSALRRMAMGRATEDDFTRLGLADGMGGGGGEGGGALFGQGLLERGLSRGATLSRRGVRGVRGLSASQVRTEVQAMSAARSGELILERDRRAFSDLEKDADATMDRIMRAQMMSGGAGNAANFYQYMGGGSANAVDAYMQRQGMVLNGTAFGAGAMMRRGGGQLNARMLAGDIGRLAQGGLVGNVLSGLGRMAAGDDLATIGADMGLESLQALGTERERAATFLARGGSLAGRLRSAGVRGRAGLTESIARAGGSASGVMDYLREQARGAEGNAALLENLEGVDANAMQALLGNETTQTSLRGILGAGSEDEFRARLTTFGQYAGGIEDEDQRMAAVSLYNQLREQSSGGRVTDPELRRALRAATRMDPRRAAQLQERMNDIGAGFQGISRRLGGALGRRYGEIGAAYFGQGGLAGNPQQLQAAQTQLNLELARLDPGSEEYQRVAEALGADDFGRAQHSTIVHYRQLQRDLSGRGRRGRRGAADSAMNQLTGGTLNELDLSVGGRSLGTRNRAQQVQRILAQGGDAAEELRRQMSTQLTAMGVEGADEMLERYQQMLSDETGRRGNLSSDEIDELIADTESNTSLQKVQREALDRRQRQQNPLDTTRNDLLLRIAQGVERVAGTAEDKGVPPESD
jgi:hypothetical protein